MLLFYPTQSRNSFCIFFCGYCYKRNHETTTTVIVQYENQKLDRKPRKINRKEHIKHMQTYQRNEHYCLGFFRGILVQKRKKKDTKNKAASRNENETKIEKF